MTYIVKLLLSIGLAIAGAGIANLVFSSPSATIPQVETTQTEPPDEATQAFIDIHTPIAQGIGKMYDVPASVLLACALQTYTFDDSGVFEQNNAWFLLPADSNWEGETFEIGKVGLRKYQTALASFEDFAEWLQTQPDTYTRNKTWWQILKDKGYDAEYLVEQFNLTQIDK